jgi:hypothetical protein
MGKSLNGISKLSSMRFPFFVMYSILTQPYYHVNIMSLFIHDIVLKYKSFTFLIPSQFDPNPPSTSLIFQTFRPLLSKPLF